MEQQITELDIPENLKNKGFRLIKDDKTIVLEDAHGNQARSQIFKEWNNTTKKFEGEIEKTQMVKDRMTLQEILMCLSKNHGKLYNGKAGSSSTNTKMDDSFETEQPLERLNEISCEEWQTELLSRYNIMKQTIKTSVMPLPQLPLSLEFALSIKNILNLDDKPLPFAGNLLGPPGALKTVTIELFRPYWHARYKDDFSPRAWVSHYSGLTPEQLAKVDLLPEVRFRFFLTPELAPLFNGSEDDIRKAFAILTRVLDGKGFDSHSGTQGSRGYYGNYMFTWLGAVVDVSSRVHRMMGNLGPRMYFLRLPKSYHKEKDLIEQLRNPRFVQDQVKVQKALFDYLKWFEACPTMEAKEGGLPKMVWDSSRDEVMAIKYVAKLAELIRSLRGVAEVQDTEDTQGSTYGYGSTTVLEEPWRANQQLYNLARGHALIEGRNYITMADIPLLVKVVLSTAPVARIAIFELLIAYKGTLKTADIQAALGITHPTIYKTMVELSLLELVDVKKDGDFNNSPLEMTLKPKFKWCLGRRFLHLRESFSPTKKPRKLSQTDKKSLDQGDNVNKDSTKLKETSEVVKENNEFWEIFNTLENGEDHTVSESALKQALVSSGKFDASDATQTIKELIAQGYITRLGFDTLVKKGAINMSKSE